MVNFLPNQTVGAAFLPPAPQKITKPPAPQKTTKPPAPQKTTKPPAPQKITKPPAPQKITKPPAPQIHIRPATIADAPACAEIHCRGWEAAYADIVPAQAIAQKNAARPAAWPGYLASGQYAYYVPVLDGKVVGFVSLGQPGANENLPAYYCEIAAIYLHPSVYRQGIGRQLMAFAEDRAREKGKTAMMLWVFEDNAPSRRFYEACGYRPDSATEEREYGRTLRSLRYVKELYTA